MKIAYFITGLGLGGAEVVTINIANHMVKRGHRVALVWLTGENAHNGVVDPAIECVKLNMSKTPWGVIYAMCRAAKWLKKFHPDVVHGNMIHANIFLRLLRLFIKMHFLISTEHSKNIEGNIRMLAYRCTDFLSDVNTNVSQEAVEVFVKAKVFKSRNSLTIYNGIDLNKFHENQYKRQQIRTQYRIKEDEFLFVNVGRLTEAKDHANLLKAFAKLEHCKLMIVGQGKLQKQIENQITQLNLVDRVILAGAHSNMADYYNAADCFVLSSAWEGFGIVIAEAMACELPVIATNAGGCAEVVANNDFMVPIRNAAALGIKMETIYKMTKKERADLGKHNRKLARRFDLQTICNQWENLYINGLKSPLLTK